MVAWASLSKRLGDCFQEAVFARCFSRVGFWVSSGRMLMKVAANAVRPYSLWVLMAYRL